ncbi:MAG: glycosyltransferase family protein [Bacteroidota bacterium]
MKILYAIQGTGNGHISRAREIIPHLLKYGELDLLISGTQAEVSLPYIIKYKKPGLGYTFGKQGGIDLVDSFKHLRPFDFLKDIHSFPVQQYDLVVNDFEPVSAWACKLKKKPCIALSHQSSFLSMKTPRPATKDGFAENLFKHYAPSTAAYGFHFKPYDSFIHTPVIRSDVRKLEPSNKGHITVYLPAHGDEILIKQFTQIKDVQWEVFSKHSKLEYTVGNVHIKPVLNEAFTQSLATGDGLITAGGFESPAEAIHLRKKVLSIPMGNQYEQLCNAQAMKDLGITVVKEIDHHFVSKVNTWAKFAFPANIYYPDNTAKIVEDLVMKHGVKNAVSV